eukprot:TRINITY_DN56506_c0_g1_i1.p1 TRINITY_DN56506_c0_g1~~TRINITY_DN56506_c0_g1_i1.p1  ORF type:complete len:469 (+),score=61.15 TRINITY_DN56506_c0_g1_i1:152-1558(+)
MWPPLRTRRSQPNHAAAAAASFFVVMSVASPTPPRTSHGSSSGGRWSVLMLGGSGFRGHPTTEFLARLGHDVTVLSRGKSYWGIMESLDKHNITHWACNRTISGLDAVARQQSGLATCDHIVNNSKTFDAVVDFSSRTLEEIKQAIELLKGRVGVYVYISSHAVYDVSKNASHGDLIRESDAVRPGREISPLERFQLKEKNVRGNKALECEEELTKQYEAGGFPYVTLRLGNVVGPKENTIRYWLIHLWLRAHIALTMPMHLDVTLLETPISMTYTLDVARAVESVISMARNETCCAEHVEAEAFNLACEEAPTQRTLYNRIAEPIGLPYVETTEMPENKSIVLYPDIIRGPMSIAKASSVLKWSPTDLGKALRSVARFYDRTMLDERRYRRELDLMYYKCKHMLGPDGPRFNEWIRAFYAERRKTELYDEHDDEDEDDILAVRESHAKRERRKQRRRRQRSAGKTDL